MRVKVPNQVVHAVLEHHAFVEQLVEGDKLLARIDAPPEPVSAGFVQRAEDGGNAFFLEVQENLGNVVDISDNCLVSGRSRIPSGGTLDECFGEVEFGVGVMCSLHVEFNFVTRAPVPREGRNAALLPGGFCDIDSLFGVLLEPAFVLVGAGCVHEVCTDECRVLAAGLENCLHVFVLGGVANGVGIHIARHYARNRLLAKVVDQEVVKLNCRRGGILGNGSVAKGERLGFEFLDFDVVNIDPAPAIGNGDRVCACCKCKDGFDIDKLAFVCNREGNLRGCTADTDIVDLVATVVVHVVDHYAVLAGFLDGNSGERDVAAVHLDVFAARCFGIRGDSCVFGECSVFGFVLCSACRCCSGKAECEKGFSKFHNRLLYCRLGK